MAPPAAEPKAIRTDAERAKEKTMNGSRKGAMKTFENLYAEPPPYSSRAPSIAPTTSTGNESLHRGCVPAMNDLDFRPSLLEIPTPAACIAHLKLLHAFAKLRRDVGNMEGLYGIGVENVGKMEESSESIPKDKCFEINGVHKRDPLQAALEAQPSSSSASLDTTLAERIRDKRWTIFVAKAVDRYHKWWNAPVRLFLNATLAVFARSIATKDFDSGLHYNVSRFPCSDDVPHKSKVELPPLDVLMVWHSHMLNPRIYLEDCIRDGRQALWHAEFPWREIYAAIDDTTFEYAQEDGDDFVKKTGRPCDALADDEPKEFKCPKCTSINRVPWTMPPLSSRPEALQAYLSEDTGFAGKAFRYDCRNCGIMLDHEILRVGKFIKDADALIKRDKPLPGTILNSRGEPAIPSPGKKPSTHDPFFPNRCVQTRPEFKPHTMRENFSATNGRSVEGIKNLFSNALGSVLDLLYINACQYKSEFVAKGSRIAVRQLMSRYWENSSDFGIDLVGAVLRQGTFVQKMVKIDWLHSPNVMATTQRLIVKYHRFVLLSAGSPKCIVVPTLDVDLAWHTHQLTPNVYYRYTLAETDKFLNHDDKIPDDDLHKAFQATALAYEKKYGQPYSECSCWYCECTREPLRSNFLNRISSLPRRRSSISVSALESKNFPKDPRLGVHVSNHNALAGTDERSAARRRKELEELDVMYAKVCKRYEKSRKGKEAPSRESKDDAYLYGAYGYPLYYPMPIYVPYYAEPGASQEHTQAPGGGCAAGTCAESASLGGCAGGEGTPGCAGSCGGHGEAAGGCGTSGSGGDGGDGGGDGGDGGGCGGCGG
ncbi:hypothetical protein J1614_005745 [Plenodomus biglobosus]|nr:hypothetical protein J1614_005745 [Plenodomus biglobosus]